MQTTRTVLYDGSRRSTVQFTGVSEGTLGDETLERKVIAAELSPVPVSLKIDSFDYNISGGIVRLYWDGQEPKQFAELTGIGNISYSKFGGMVNSAATPITGDVLLSTIGFDTGSSYNLVANLIKKF